MLLTLYSAAVMGVPLHYHYCGGELQHITLFVQKECDSHGEEEHEKHEESPFSCCLGKEVSHCGTTSDTSEGDCCDNEADFMQYDHDVSVQSDPLSFDTHATAAAASADLLNLAASAGVLQNLANGPPLIQAKIYLAICSLVFYG